MICKNFLPYALLAAVGMAFASCDDNENKIEGHGQFVLYTQLTDSLDYFVNNNAVQDADDIVYAADTVINDVFRFSHYCRAGQFAGGITVSNMSLRDSIFDGNYSSIVGHGALTYVDTPDRYNATFFIGDLRQRCRIMFKTDVIGGWPLYPKAIYVTNAALTYHAIKEGAGGYPAFTTDDRLTLRITALAASGSATSRYVDVSLADDGNALNSWSKIELKPLGEAYGISFSLIAADGTTDARIPVPPLFCFDCLEADYSYSVAY